MYSIWYKEIDKDKSVEENFLLAIETERRRNDTRMVALYEGIEIYYHLFKMLSFYCPNYLTQASIEYLDSEDWWFYNFHKQFRQLDMFDGAGYFDRKISKENAAIRKDMLAERHQYIQENKPSYKEYENEGEWCEGEKAFFNSDKFLKTNRECMLPFNRAYNSFEMKESFGGHMDMVVWLTISNDNGVLYKFMDEFLAMYHGVTGYEEKRMFSKEDK